MSPQLLLKHYLARIVTVRLWLAVLMVLLVCAVAVSRRSSHGAGEPRRQQAGRRGGNRERGETPGGAAALKPGRPGFVGDEPFPVKLIPGDSRERLSVDSTGRLIESPGLDVSPDDLPSHTGGAIHDTKRNSSWTNGVYWSQESEDTVTREAIRAESSEELARTVRERDLVGMTTGCGHSQNRLLTFGDGRRVCCRYRNSLDLVQGEIYTFSLARVLGVDNLPPTAFGVVNVTGRRWRAVRANVTRAEWATGHRVVFSGWVADLVPAFLPGALLGPAGRLHPPDVAGASRPELAGLVQWSDLIVLDYLTGNMDRMVNMLVNRRWNAFIMDGPVHNLKRSEPSGQLLFLDNELSFAHSYRLLDRYGHFHGDLLAALCVFRSPTVEAMRALHAGRGVWQAVWDYSLRSGLFGPRDLPKLSQKNIGILNSRVADVLEQVNNCERLYN